MRIRNFLTVTCVGFVIALLAAATPAHAIIDAWIDPGHGAVGAKQKNGQQSYDIGASGIDGDQPPNEADFAWYTAQWVQGYLESYGYSTALTRNANGARPDTLTPKQRTGVLNGTRPNDLLFQDAARIILSVHMNSTTSPSAIGTTTYWNPKSGPGYTYNFAQSYALALAVHPDLMTYVNVAFLPCHSDRHIQIGNFFMIRDVNAPAVLVEVCFISNQCQFNIIDDDNSRSLVGEGIAIGADGYLSSLDGHAPRSGRPARFTQPLRVVPPSFRQGLSTRPYAALSSFSEGFDGSTFPPAGWTTSTSGAPPPYTWRRTTDTLIVQAGTGAALVAGQYSSANDEWLISPMIRVGSGDTGLSFYWAGNRDLAAAVNATCNIRPKGNPSWTQVWSLASEPPATRFVYRDRAISLTPYAGDSIQFAFRVQGTFGADFAVDEVAMGNLPPTAAPANDACPGTDFPAGTFELSGVTCYGSNDLDPRPSCVDDFMDGPDVVYRLQAAAGDTLSVSIEGAWNPGLYLINSCASPNCIDGAYPVDAATPASFTHIFATGGTYYLVVDGPQGNCGPFRLSGTFRGVLTGVGDSPRSDPRLQLLAFPNPFGSSVSLRAEIPRGVTGTPEMSIHDLAGRQIASLHPLIRDGTCEIEWNGRTDDGYAVAPGAYFAKLRIGNFVVQRLLTLTR